MQITDNEEIYYSMALTRLSGVNHAVALQLYKELGDAQAVYEATKARLPWDEALHRAAAELALTRRCFPKPRTLPCRR